MTEVFNNCQTSDEMKAKVRLMTTFIKLLCNPNLERACFGDVTLLSYQGKTVISLVDEDVIVNDHELLEKLVK